MCRGAALVPGVADLAQAGVRTGRAVRNRASYGAAVQMPADISDWRRNLLADPQTSGGLLVAVAPDAVGAVLRRVVDAGLNAARVVGG